MSWSEDFVKLLPSLLTSIKTTKCQSSLSTPCRCSSRYAYTGTLWRCTCIYRTKFHFRYFIINPLFLHVHTEYIGAIYSQLVLGCQAQPFLAFIILLCIGDIWLACWLLVSSWCHIKFPLGFYVAVRHSCTMYLPHARGGPGVYPCLVHPLGNSASRVVHIAVVAMKLYRIALCGTPPESQIREVRVFRICSLKYP